MSTDTVPACGKCRHFADPYWCCHPEGNRVVWDYLYGTLVSMRRAIEWMRSDGKLGTAGPCGHEGKLWEANTSTPPQTRGTEAPGCP